MATLTATGGASGNPVVFTVDATSGTGVCKVSGTNGATVSYTAPGSCMIDASQAAAQLRRRAPGQQTIVVSGRPGDHLHRAAIGTVVGRPR